MTGIQKKHMQLLAHLERTGAVASSLVAQALADVPRHAFVPEVPAEDAYDDRAIVIGYSHGRPSRSISQPTVVAQMLEQLQLRPGLRVLEIGAGTGYNAALLAHCVGADAVTTIDIDPAMCRRAREALALAGFGAVHVVNGDAASIVRGVESFDRIVVTVGAWDIEPAWYEALREGGIIVTPLSFGGMQCTPAFRKSGNRLLSISITTCGFMPMEGRNSGPRVSWRHPKRPGIVASHEFAESLSESKFWKGLDAASVVERVDGLREFWAGGSAPFLYYLALRGYRIVYILDDAGSLGCVAPSGGVLVFQDAAAKQDRLLAPRAKSVLRHAMAVLGEWQALGSPAITSATMSAERLVNQVLGEAHVMQHSSRIFEVIKSSFRYHITFRNHLKTQ